VSSRLSFADLQEREAFSAEEAELKFGTTFLRSNSEAYSATSLSAIPLLYATAFTWMPGCMEMTPQ
jgi:hypothetical protein